MVAGRVHGRRRHSERKTPNFVILSPAAEPFQGEVCYEQAEI
jgi:hypothetical protein